MTHDFTNYLPRSTSPTPTSTPALCRASRRFLRNTRWRGTHPLPYMDGFLFLGDSYHAALITRLGLLRNPKKVF
jgi:hypothetical protein